MVGFGVNVVVGGQFVYGGVVYSRFSVYAGVDGGGGYFVRVGYRVNRRGHQYCFGLGRLCCLPVGGIVWSPWYRSSPRFCYRYNVVGVGAEPVVGSRGAGEFYRTLIGGGVGGSGSLSFVIDEVVRSSGTFGEKLDLVGIVNVDGVPARGALACSRGY